jgi:starch synthase (maltosyl-transferring)
VQLHAGGPAQFEAFAARLDIPEARLRAKGARLEEPSGHRRIVAIRSANGRVELPETHSGYIVLPELAAPAPERIVIQNAAPAVDNGAFAAKRCVGDRVAISAEIFADGHDQLGAAVRYRQPGARSWRELPMRWIDERDGGVRYAAELLLDRAGRWEYDVTAWIDRFGTWRGELARKLQAGQQQLAGELSEGVLLLESASARARVAADRKLLDHAIGVLSDAQVPESAKHDVALGEELFTAVEAEQERVGAVSLPAPLRIEVDRVRARFGAWYELFPRSWGGLRGVERQIPLFAERGFDILYLPPIHPIGHTNRKGANNALHAAAGDPGSPWAIGDETGGHDALHPELGTAEDLRKLVSTATSHGIEIALDFAIQCSADHPWLREHPEWFHHRPDGTLKYAENPPKRYQDIYNVNWDCPDWKRLWNALLEVVLHWVDCGVKVFRVDNPHTKPFAFWMWLIERVHARDRDVVFLAEAFTRRAVMRHLAKLGFSQSYTYFTWKNSRYELTEYVTELAYSGEQEYFRPNFFINTPDILHAYLQHGGRPAFEARLVLAATLSPAYGIYSGFERIENVPIRPGSEEYLDSEKYEIKQRSLDGELLPLISQLNHIRRQNAALQEFSNVAFLETENEALIAYAKRSPGNMVIVVVNIDPHQTQAGVAVIPDELVDSDQAPDGITVHDLLTGDHYLWHRGPNYIRLTPGERQAHVLQVVS